MLLLSPQLIQVSLVSYEVEDLSGFGITNQCNDLLQSAEYHSDSARLRSSFIAVGKPTSHEFNRQVA